MIVAIVSSDLASTSSLKARCVFLSELEYFCAANLRIDGSEPAPASATSPRAATISDSGPLDLAWPKIGITQFISVLLGPVAACTYCRKNTVCAPRSQENGLTMIGLDTARLDGDVDSSEDTGDGGVVGADQSSELLDFTDEACFALTVDV